ncbi:hypothetical protein AZI86_16705 [Bdellovibrio bacteriovorus]|uniref:Uncharacterized protein n=1 Tax=Bdellovibrio bacteriovorus TaxID=959 RepID=A0A150WH20_BDEBC|nr:hypothetical protein [Bdellovibrio bacteriovorus]KYG62472.1 hypothetical protein AZI86_16705 [Bdellovibrio bacteriovorus]
MKKWASVFLAALTCFLADPSGAVSRVGGGKVRSQFSGFALTIPSEYFRVEASGENAVIARGPMFFGSATGRIEAFIRISEFSTYFADAQDLTADQLEQRLSKSGWIRVHWQGTCEKVFKNESGGVLSYVVTWGAGRGFVINASKLEYSERSIAAMLASLEIEPGSCAWK